MNGGISSRWIVDFKKQIDRGKHILLYGNVHDQFLSNGTYKAADEFLRGWFLDQDFDVVVEYDTADGFHFPLDTMKGVFDRLAEQSVLRTSLGTSSSTTPIPQTHSSTAVERRELPPRTLPSTTQPTNTPPELREAAAKIRRAVKQPNTSVAAIVRFADLSSRDHDRYSRDETPALLQLKKATLEASLVTVGRRYGFRNTVVLVAGDLKRVPEWLYLENPFVSLVHATRPDRRERRQFAISFLNQFHDGNALSVDETGELADEFADRTDGMQAWDLDALRRTSLMEQLPARHVRRLVDFYRFGQRTDPWKDGLAPERIVNAAAELGRRVIGQPKAVHAVVSMLMSANMGVTMNPAGPKGGKPRGVFFFVGPTGVGKTELAKALTHLVFRDETQFERFDMSEYKEEHAAEKLTGSPPGYVGYGQGGRLTNRVMERPHSILLFDEIEKAHPRVLDKFLQILEDGRLTDGRGQTAYFDQTAIIFTSNIGASDLTDERTGAVIRNGIMSRFNAGEDIAYDDLVSFFRGEVAWYFTSRIGRAELLNRLGDSIVVFDVVRPEACRNVAEKFLAILQESAKNKLELTLRFTASVASSIEAQMRLGDNLLYGGRRVRTLLETQVEKPLNEWLFHHQPVTSMTIEVSLDEAGTATFKRV